MERKRNCKSKQDQMASNMMCETVWLDQPRVESAEKLYQEMLGQRHSGLEVVVSDMVLCTALLAGLLCYYYYIRVLR